MEKMYNDLKDEWGWESPLDLLHAMLAFELGDLYGYLIDNPGDEDQLEELLAQTATHWMAWISDCSTNNCSMESANMVFNFVGRMHTMRSRYKTWHDGGSPSFAISSKRAELATGVLQKMMHAPGEWYTGGYNSNGHPSTWGNSRYPKDGKWVDFWPDHDKVTEFSNVSDGFNQISDSSGYTVSFKFGNFAVLTVDEKAYWTASP